MAQASRIVDQASDRGLHTSSSVGIVIVNYNCQADTLRCVESVRSQHYPNYFIVLVDSRSPDGSGERLRNLLEPTGVRFVQSAENSGFAHACNLGMCIARTMGAELLWLLNPDTSVEPDALSNLVTQAQRFPDVAAFGSKILYGDTQPTVPSGAEAKRVWGVGGVVDLQHRTVAMIGSGEQDRSQWGDTFECDYIPGCSLMLRKDVLSQVGYMPEEYFMYFEETEWCMQMKRCGLTLMCVPSSVVYHHFDDAKLQRAFGVYYYNRNALLFWYRRMSRRNKYLLVLKTLFQTFPRALRALYLAPDSELQAVYRAHVVSNLDFLRGKFGRRPGY